MLQTVLGFFAAAAGCLDEITAKLNNDGQNSMRLPFHERSTTTKLGSFSLADSTGSIAITN